MRAVINKGIVDSGERKAFAYKPPLFACEPCAVHGIEIQGKFCTVDSTAAKQTVQDRHRS